MKLRSLAVLSGFAVLSAGAQDIRGTISGTVIDPQNAPVVGAAVAVTEIQTNVSTSLTTNASGYYEGLCCCLATTR